MLQYLLEIAAKAYYLQKQNDRMDNIVPAGEFLIGSHYMAAIFTKNSSQSLVRTY